MSVGDVYSFEIIGTMQGQPVCNIFHYEVTSETGPEVIAPDFPAAWKLGSLLTLWKLNFAGAYNVEAFRAQRIYNGNNSTLKSLQPFQDIVNETGTGGSDPPPSLNTVITIYNTDLGPDEIFFKGRKFMSAGTELTLQDGRIDSILELTINDFFDELKTPLDLGSGKVAQFGVWSLTRAKALLTPVILPVSIVQIRLNTGAFQARKRGTSRGGFQP